MKKRERGKDRKKTEKGKDRKKKCFWILTSRQQQDGK